MRSTLCAAVLALVAAGCGSPPPSAERLSDPRQIIAGTFESTTTLRTVHLAIESDVAAAALVGAVGNTVVDVVLFNRDSTACGWVRSDIGGVGSDPFASVPSKADVAKALDAALRAPRI